MAKTPLTMPLKKSGSPAQALDEQAMQKFVYGSGDTQQTTPLPAATTPMSMPKNQTKTFPLLLSAEVHQEIAAAARRDGKSIKDFILTAIYEKMERNG